MKQYFIYLLLVSLIPLCMNGKSQNDLKKFKDSNSTFTIKTDNLQISLNGFGQIVSLTDIFSGVNFLPKNVSLKPGQYLAIPDGVTMACVYDANHTIVKEVPLRKLYSYSKEKLFSYM